MLPPVFSPRSAFSLPCLICVRRVLANVGSHGLLHRTPAAWTPPSRTGRKSLRNIPELPVTTQNPICLNSKMKSFHVLFNKHHVKNCEWRLCVQAGVLIFDTEGSGFAFSSKLVLHCWIYSRMSNKPRMLLSFPSASFSYESFWHLLCQYQNALDVQSLWATHNWDKFVCFWKC